MSLYRPHGNPLSISCAKCHTEIILGDTFPYQDKIYCEHCYEKVSGEVIEDEGYDND